MKIYHDKTNRLLKGHKQNILCNRKYQTLWICINDNGKSHLDEFMNIIKDYSHYMWLAVLQEKTDSKIVEFKKAFGKLSMYNLSKDSLDNLKIEFQNCNCYLDLAKIETREQKNEFNELIDNRYNSRNHFGIISRADITDDEIKSYEKTIIEILSESINLKEENFIFDKLLESELTEDKIGIFLAEDNRCRKFFVLVSSEKEMCGLMQKFQSCSVMDEYIMRLIEMDEFVFSTPFIGLDL